MSDQYIRKPEFVQARQWDGTRENLQELTDWSRDSRGISPLRWSSDLSDVHLLTGRGKEVPLHTQDWLVLLMRPIREWRVYRPDEWVKAFAPALENTPLDVLRHLNSLIENVGKFGTSTERPARMLDLTEEERYGLTVFLRTGSLADTTTFARVKLAEWLGPESDKDRADRYIELLSQAHAWLTGGTPNELRERVELALEVERSLRESRAEET